MAEGTNFVDPTNVITNKIGKLNISQRANNPSHPIMTINMNGKSEAEERRKLLIAILQSFSSAIVFCQEPFGYFEMLIPESCIAVKNEDQAAVIWSTKHFKGSDERFKTTNKEIIRIHDQICGKEAAGSEILSRITMVKLTSKQNKTESTLAVSFHGPHRLGKEVKHDVFFNLLAFLKVVITENGISSYIIGGDFNINTLEVANLPQKVAVHSYTPSSRSQTKAKEKTNFISYKDNFIYYPDTILNVDSIAVYMLNTTEETLLDHDPVVGNLRFIAQTKESSQTKDGPILKSAPNLKMVPILKSASKSEESPPIRKKPPNPKKTTNLKRAPNLKRSPLQIEVLVRFGMPDWRVGVLFRFDS
jgi:hypothetical protein